MQTENSFKLIYWPGFPGRGEFVRLAFEATGTPYEDTALTQTIDDVLTTVDPQRQIKDKDVHFAVPVLNPSPATRSR